MKHPWKKKKDNAYRILVTRGSISGSVYPSPVNNLSNYLRNQQIHWAACETGKRKASSHWGSKLLPSHWVQEAVQQHSVGASERLQEATFTVCSLIFFFQTGWFYFQVFFVFNENQVASKILYLEDFMSGRFKEAVTVLWAAFHPARNWLVVGLGVGVVAGGKWAVPRDVTG